MSRVAVIGGGVTGLCSAYYLNQLGYEVTVLDQGDLRDGCSWGNAGMIVPSHFIPLAAPGMPALGLKLLLDPSGPFSITPRLERDLFSWVWKFYRHSTNNHVERSRGLLFNLNHRSGVLYNELAFLKEFDFKLKNKGLIMYCRELDTLTKETKVAGMANQLGVDARVMSRSELQKLDPGLELNVAGGVFFPGDSFFDPGLFMHQLVNSLENSGVQFIRGFRGEKLIREQNSIRAVDGNEHFEADHFVLAAGVWSQELAKPVGLNLLMEGGKGYSFTVPQSEYLPEICSILLEARIAVTPMGSNLRFAGTMELNGVNTSISSRRLTGMKTSIPDYFPQFSESDFRDLDTWVGLRPCSPDGLPYLGKTRYSNLFVATGNAMMGMSLGPVSGKIISQLVDGQEPESDLSLLDPERFS